MKKNKNVRAAYPLAILSLILLCNPNIGVVDVLPDFIACFILAGLLSPGVDRAPYFAEARVALMRLGWLNVAKIGGLIVIGYSRMQNAFGNDTSVVVVTVFSVAELMLGIMAARAVFNALFGLGERTEMNSTIKDTDKVKPSGMPTNTFAFLTVKAAFNVIPNLFLLTKVDENGMIATVSKGYSIVLVTSTLLVLICGVAWCVTTIKYLKSIHREGQFYSSIYSLSNEENERRIVRKHKCEIAKAPLTLLIIAIVTLIDLKFDNTLGINLAPNFIFGIISLIAVLKLRKSTKRGLAPAFMLAAAYTVVSLESFVMESIFLYNYGYSALLHDGIAHSVYNAVEVLALIELITLTAFAVALGELLISFAHENTALSPSDERYSRTDADFHRSLKRRIIIFVAMIITIGVIRCVAVFSNGHAQLILNQHATATVSSALPFMGAVATALVVVLIAYTYVIFSSIKEDVDLKYGGE